MRPTSLLISTCLLLTSASATATTEDLPLPPPPDTDTAPPPPAPTAAEPSGQFLIGVQAGPTFPGLFNKLNVSGFGAIEGAYQLPVMNRSLGIFLRASYTQPTANGTRLDARVGTNGGSETYHLSVMDLGLSLGLNFLLPLPAKFIGFAALGLDVHLSRSVLDQQAGGADLGHTTEDSTRVGHLCRIGAGYPIGPGYLTLELENEYAGIDHLITAVANTAHFSTALGYMLRL